MEFKEFIAERKRMCKAHTPDGIICRCAELKCPLYALKQLSPEKSCYAGCTRYPEDAEMIVKQWGKDNPPITNLQKYKEILKKTFGVNIDEEEVSRSCPLHKMPLFCTLPRDCNKCLSWWNEPYKEPEK